MKLPVYLISLINSLFTGKMVRTRRKKTDRGNTKIEVFEAAALDVKTKNLSIRKAAASHGINFMTLQRFLQKQKKMFGKPATAIQMGYAKPRQIFSVETEIELVEYITYSSKILFGLTTKEVRSLAFQYAVANNISVPQNWSEVAMASVDWLQGFLKRHPGLSIRTPQATSLGRATSFNRHTVNEFQNNLAQILEKYRFEAKDIWNVDETGVTTVQRPSKIIAVKGSKQVGAITSAERGQLVTMVFTVSAEGNSVPPMFIFPRKFYRDTCKIAVANGPVGSVGESTESGWITKDEFLKFVKHFAKHTRCTPEQPVLLLLDNHNAHLSVAVIDFCRSNGIVMLSFPPHTTHRLQPLDRSVYGPFKRFYNSFCDSWMKSNPAKTMSIYNIPGIVKEALPLAATPGNIQAGFKATGIWPFNREIFGDDEFLPSAVTDRSLQAGNDLISHNSLDVSGSNDNDHASFNTAPSTETVASEKNQSAVPSSIRTGTKSSELDLPDHSWNKPGPSQSKNTDEKKLTENSVSLQDLRPYPKAGDRKGKQRNRKTRKSLILTSTPVKEALQNEEVEREEKKRRKLETAKKKIPLNGSQNFDVLGRNIKKPKRKLKKQPRRSTSSEEEEDCFCIECQGPWSERKPGEDWVQCKKCLLWAHFSCAKMNAFYKCSNCEADEDIDFSDSD